MGMLRECLLPLLWQVNKELFVCLCLPHPCLRLLPRKVPPSNSALYPSSSNCLVVFAVWFQEYLLSEDQVLHMLHVLQGLGVLAHHSDQKQHCEGLALPHFPRLSVHRCHALPLLALLPDNRPVSGQRVVCVPCYHFPDNRPVSGQRVECVPCYLCPDNRPVSGQSVVCVCTLLSLSGQLAGQYTEHRVPCCPCPDNQPVSGQRVVCVPCYLCPDNRPVSGKSIVSAPCCPIPDNWICCPSQQIQ